MTPDISADKINTAYIYLLTLKILRLEISVDKRKRVCFCVLLKYSFEDRSSGR
jgi:hypothetical protein